MRVVVFGGREYGAHKSGLVGQAKADDRERVAQERARFERVMDHLHGQHKFTAVIHGAARGADSLADAWALKRGLVSQPFPADWSTKRKNAGPIRNQQMITEGKPEFAVGWPGGTGTDDMWDRVKRAGIPHMEVAAVRAL